MSNNILFLLGLKCNYYKLLVLSFIKLLLSVIMSSSELPELLSISNRILVLHQGRVAGIVEGEDINQHNVLNLAVRGFEAPSNDYRTVKNKN